MLPNVNQIIRISMNQNDQFIYKARVADISNDSFSIEIPVDERTGSLKLIPVGTPIKVWYISNDRGQISFDSKVVKLKKEQVPLLCLEYPENFHRVQRRDYLRVDTTVETSFKIKDGINQKWNIVRTLDLSGGGMRILLPPSVELHHKNMIEGWIVLPFKNGTIHHVKYEGEIVRIHVPNDRIAGKWVSIKFNKLNENMRATVVRFCYEKQVEAKKVNG